MKILFGKKVLDFPVEGNMDIASVKHLIQVETGFDSIRLISNGKTLEDDIAVNSLPGGVFSKLTMIASHSNSLTDRRIRVKNDLTTIRESIAEASKSRSTKNIFSQDGYGFQGIQTLPGLRDESRAREILEDIASDPGFLSVMKKHKWNVSTLGELYPEGLVGISEVCVLGLNENKGQRILLRIRTDDLMGFRKTLTIREVLCHELAHMEHSDHDDNFFRLMRQIQKEILELDWTRSAYRTLSDGRGQVPSSIHEDNEGDEDPMPKTLSLINELNDNMATVVSPKMESAFSSSKVNAEISTIKTEEAVAEYRHSASSPPPVLSECPDATMVQVTSIKSHSTSLRQNQFQRAHEVLDRVSTAVIYQDFVSSPERTLRVIDAVRNIISASGTNFMDVDEDQVGEDRYNNCVWVLRLLKKIIVNAKTGEVRTRYLRKDTHSLRRLLDNSNGVASVVLMAVGFHDEVDAYRMVSTDEAFLYIAEDILSSVIDGLTD